MTSAKPLPRRFPAFLATAFLAPARFLVPLLTLAVADPGVARSAAPTCVNLVEPPRAARGAPPGFTMPSSLPSAELRVTPTKGYPGQAIAVQGKIFTGAPRVSVVLYDGQVARGLVEAEVGPTGEFLLDAEVPADAAPAKATICALSSGLVTGESDIGCVSFKVVAPPRGAIAGSVMLESADGSPPTPAAQATVLLRTAAGVPVASATTSARGRYSFRGLAPGKYIVQPLTDQAVAAPALINLLPKGKGQNIALVPYLPDLPSAWVNAVGGVALPMGALAKYDPKYFKPPFLVTDIDRELAGGFFARFVSLPGQGLSTSVYVRFYADGVTFFDPSPDRSVRFEILDGASVIKAHTSTQQMTVYGYGSAYDFKAYTMLVDVSKLPPGELTLKVTPRVGGVDGPSRIHKIVSVDLESRWFSPYTTAKPVLEVSPGDFGLKYAFFDALAKPLLPKDVPINMLVKTFQNTLDGSANVSEIFDTTYGTQKSSASFTPYAKLFDKTILDGYKSHSLTPHLQGEMPGSFDLPLFDATGTTNFVSYPIFDPGSRVHCWDPCPDFCCGDCPICAGWEIIVKASLGGHVELASQIDDHLPWNFDTVPFADLTISGHARAELVVCGAEGNCSGKGGAGLPIHYDNSVPSLGLEAPCLQISGECDGELSCFDFGFGAGGGVGPFYYGNCPGASAPVAGPVCEAMEMSPASGSTDATGSTASIAGACGSARPPVRAHTFHVDPAPTVATDGGRHALALWVEDTSDTPGTVAPVLRARYFDGMVWGTAEDVTPAPAAINDPAVVFLAPARALAVWTQNSASLADIHERGKAELAEQEIFWALRGPAGWGMAQRLTDDLIAEGLVSLAAAPGGGGALAVWTRRLDSPVDNARTNSFGIVSAWYDGSMWHELTAIDPDPTAVDSEVSLQFGPDGTAWAVWVRDADGDMTTFVDRHLRIANWNGSAWSASEIIAGVPQGVTSPAIAVDSHGTPLIVFVVRERDGDGNPPAERIPDTLWSAFRRGRAWEVVPVLGGTAAEQPQVAVNGQDSAVIAFRGFDARSNGGRQGELAAAVADLRGDSTVWTRGFLSDDGQTNWKTAFAIDAGSAAGFVVNVKQSPADYTFTRSATLRHADEARGVPAVGADPGRTLPAVQLNADNGGPAVVATIAPWVPDLAVAESDIVFSDEHPAPGSAVMITATVRNLGLAPAEARAPVTVRFYAVEDERRGRRQIAEETIDRLAFNEEVAVSVPYIVPARGLVTVMVVADAGGAVQESDETNNTAERALGETPSPAGLGVTALPDRTALRLDWDAVLTDDDIAGFVVLRAMTPAGPWDRVGFTTATSFVDTLVEPGAAYAYAVAAVDVCGVVSAPSDVASGLVAR